MPPLIVELKLMAKVEKINAIDFSYLPSWLLFLLYHIHYVGFFYFVFETKLKTFEKKNKINTIVQENTTLETDMPDSNHLSRHLNHLKHNAYFLYTCCTYNTASTTPIIYPIFVRKNKKKK